MIRSSRFCEEPEELGVGLVELVLAEGRLVVLEKVVLTLVVEVELGKAVVSVVEFALSLAVVSLNLSPALTSR
jgi:hypothetical protein